MDGQSRRSSIDLDLDPAAAPAAAAARSGTDPVIAPETGAELDPGSAVAGSAVAGPEIGLEPAVAGPEIDPGSATDAVLPAAHTEQCQQPLSSNWSPQNHHSF